jgi:SnoaL-like domain
MPFTGALEDRIAIRELLDTYADALTREDAGLMTSLWIEDGDWSLLDYPAVGTVHGRDNIIARWLGAMDDYRGVMLKAWPGSIEVEGNEAKVRCYTSEVFDRHDITFRERGIYDDICIKTDGQWKFKSRSFRTTHAQKSPKSG